VDDENSRVRKLLWQEAKLDIYHQANTVKKCTNYLSWDDYFMSMAFLSAKRSKDPHNQSGACIVDSENKIVGIGYNGFPRGCHDDCLPWADFSKNDESILHTKNPFICHAEVNAVLNKCSENVKGATLYVHQFPCNESAKVIIQAGISNVVYLENKYECHFSRKASRIMFEMANIQTRQYSPTLDTVDLDFGSMVGSKLDQKEFYENLSSSQNDVSQKENGTVNVEQIQKKYRNLLLKEAQYDPLDDTTNVGKREGYLSWDDYFMSVAFLSAKRSKDPSTQVGACIVNIDKCIIGIGYNGFPRGCSDEYLPWSRSAECSLHTKYPYVVHAEVNAILNKCSADVKGATLYVALFPCNDCAKVIIQAGIKEVVFLSDKYHDTDHCRASRIMFKMAGVKLRQHSPHKRKIIISLVEKS